MVNAPSGPNNKDNIYYARVNHIKIARVDYNRTEFFGTLRGVPDGGITIFATSFNDATDEASFSTTRLGTLYWATHLTGQVLEADGNGGWTGATLEDGSTVIDDAAETYLIPYTVTSGTSGNTRKVSYYIRNGSVDSNLITETFTIN